MYTKFNLSAIEIQELDVLRKKYNGFENNNIDRNRSYGKRTGDIVRKTVTLFGTAYIYLVESRHMFCDNNRLVVQDLSGIDLKNKNTVVAEPCEVIIPIEQDLPEDLNDFMNRALMCELLVEFDVLNEEHMKFLERKTNEYKNYYDNCKYEVLNDKIIMPEIFFNKINFGYEYFKFAVKNKKLV
jgi:hypothetical protein